MGNGCSHPTDRFSQYQKIHSKVQKNIPPRPSFKSNLEKKKTLETAAKSPTDQKKVVETIRLYTSNTFYEHLKKGKSLKELIPLSSNENSPFLDLIEEMRLYLNEVIENSSMAGILEAGVIKEAKTVLLEISEKISSKNEGIDFNETRLYRVVLVLVELYHIIKFLKDEGIFQEGKWWTQSDQEYIMSLGKKLEKILDRSNEKNQSSESQLNESSDSSDSSEQPAENIIKSVRMKKWETLAKENEMKEEEKESNGEKNLKEEKESKAEMQSKEEKQSKVEENIEPTSHFLKSPSIAKNLQKPEFIMSMKKRNSKAISEFKDLNVIDPPKKEENKENIEKTEKTETENLAKNPDFKEKINVEEKFPEPHNFKEEIHNDLIVEEKFSEPDISKKNPSNIDKLDIDSLEKSPQLNQDQENSDFKINFKEAQRLSRISLQAQTNEIIAEDFAEDLNSPFRPKQKYSDSQKDNEENRTLSHVESGDFLAEFFLEARENIKEVIELLLIQETNLKKSGKIENENDVITDSLFRMRNFESFLEEIANKPFTTEISEELKRYLVDMKSIKQVINEKFAKNISIPSPQILNSEKKTRKFEHGDDPRPSIEMMTEFQQSLDNFKSKIRESMHKLSVPKEGLIWKKKARDFEEIEKEFESEMLNMRSIHRKESFKSNCESLYVILDETYQNINGLKKMEVFNKEVLNESMMKVQNSQQNLKIFYEKLVEKHDQIVYEDLDKDDSNLKVIRNTQNQLAMLRDYLKGTLESNEK